MRKGISAVIATIMLLMISVSLIGVFYVFSSTLAGTTAGAGSQQASQLTSQLSMCMQIRNIYNNQITLENCGKGVIENKSLVVMMDDVKLGASTLTINEGDSGTVNISGLWQIPFGKRNMKISNGATFALALVDVQPNKDGLVGSWDFNEGSGTTANDGSGNGNIGTLLPAGSEPQWVSGKFGKGLQFDSVNDYVQVPDSSSLDVTGSITISVWINEASYSWHEAIVTKGSVGDGWGYLLQDYHPSGEAGHIGFYTDNTNWDASNKRLSLGRWTHVVVSYSPPNKLIYIDGTLDTPVPGPRNGAIVATSASLWIGRRSDGYYFNGIIDEVRIWSRALTPDDTVIMKQII